jgi:trimeric autotransporter adhesin
MGNSPGPGKRAGAAGRSACATFVVALLLLAGVGSATEHRGVVRFGGLPLPGATVSATRGEQRVATVADSDGAYSFANLADGSWAMRVEMQCFAPMERQISVGSGSAAAEWDLRLLPLDRVKASVGAPTPPPPPAVSDARHAKKAKLPKSVPPPAAINTASEFQKSEAKATAESQPAEENNPAPQTGKFALAPADGFLINGSVNNGAATPFAQSAAFGNNRRKNGSQYNASLGLVFNNAFWDARSYSLTGQETPKPGYSRLQGLASFGGPIHLPHIAPREGVNWNVNYQWIRNRNATTQSARVPTGVERLGGFTQSLDALGRPVRVIDPGTGAPLAGNLVPVSRISPQALALLSFYPSPNFASTAKYNYQVPLVGATHQDSLQTRGNKVVGRKNQVSGMFAMQSTRSDSTNLFGFLDTSSVRGWMASANWMHRFGLRSFADIRFNFSRQSSRATPFFAGRTNVSGVAGITENNQEPANWGPPALSFSSGIAGLSDGQNSSSHYRTADVSASLFQARGSHNVSFGGSFRRQQFNLVSQQEPRGSFAFTGAAAGSDFAGFLLGIPDTSSIAFGNADKYLRATGHDAFINDDFHATSFFTVNGGLRWEYGSPVTEKYGRLVNLAIAPGYSVISPSVAATSPDPLLRPFRHALSPRIGISWRPIAGSSMVVRAGYGVYYDTSVYLPIALRMAQQPPLSKTLSIANSAAKPLTLANGFNAPASTATNTFAVDPAFRSGYAQNWQASVQRDLPGSLVMTATYLGAKGTRAQQQFLPQTYPAGAANPCTACPSGYAFLASNGSSTRHSGQFQLRRRLHSGLTAQINYTFAKSIDDAALGGRGQGATVIAQDWLNLAGERGLSPFDQRHLLNAQAQFASGMGLKGGTLIDGWRGRLMKDWTTTANFAAGSGLPQTPIWVAAVRGTGITGSIRPDYTGAPLYDSPAGAFLNPVAVAAPASGRWGNAGRNSITGPGQFALNASLARTFRLKERVNADLRFESTNVLNHVTWTRWNVVATSAQFGLPSAANAMRSMQANLRVRF